METKCYTAVLVPNAFMHGAKGGLAEGGGSLKLICWLAGRKNLSYRVLRHYYGRKGGRGRGRNKQLADKEAANHRWMS